MARSTHPSFAGGTGRSGYPAGVAVGGGLVPGTGCAIQSETPPSSLFINSHTDDLFRAIERVAHGESVLDPAALESVMRGLVRPDDLP